MKGTLGAKNSSCLAETSKEFISKTKGEDMEMRGGREGSTSTAERSQNLRLVVFVFVGGFLVCQREIHRKKKVGM